MTWLAFFASLVERPCRADQRLMSPSYGNLAMAMQRVCQPGQMAIRNACLTELIEQGLRCFALLGVALAHDLIKNFARTAGITHFLICLGQIKFRRNLLPLLAFAFWHRFGCSDGIVKVQTDAR